ncbi:MAG: chromate transporter [Chitinophagaceae bacterium]
MTGYGMLQAVPGPVFSICTFVGGIAMSSEGPLWQILGCVTATVGIFLPSTLMMLFLFPLYQSLKNYVIIYRSIEGINAAIVGMVWASGLILFRSPSANVEIVNIVIAGITFCILQFTKDTAPFYRDGLDITRMGHQSVSDKDESSSDSFLQGYFYQPALVYYRARQCRTVSCRLFLSRAGHSGLCADGAMDTVHTL